VSADRRRVADWLGGVAGVGAAGIAMLVCCATTIAAAGGGVAAAGGILRSPWLIIAGVVLSAVAVAAIILRRSGRAKDTVCGPLTIGPTAGTGQDGSQEVPAPTDQTRPPDPRAAQTVSGHVLNRLPPDRRWTLRSRRRAVDQEGRRG
jgi:hypothetical protein